MSETTKAVFNQDGEETKLAVQNAPAQLQMSPEEIEAQIARAKSINPKDAPEVGVLYWEAKAGESHIGIFQGWTMLTPKDKDPILAAVVRVSPELAYMSAAVQLVSKLQFVDIGSSVYVECTSDKSGGAYQFGVKLLERQNAAA